jgi:hypothetical protein
MSLCLLPFYNQDLKTLIFVYKMPVFYWIWDHSPIRNRNVIWFDKWQIHIKITYETMRTNLASSFFLKIKQLSQLNPHYVFLFCFNYFNYCCDSVVFLFCYNYITSVFHWNVTIWLVMKWSHYYKRDVSHPNETQIRTCMCLHDDVRCKQSMK